MDPGPSFTSEIQSTALFYFLHFLPVTIIFHTIRLILCDQQASEIDNLTVTLGQSFLVVLCRCCLKYYWFDNLGFFLRENLLLYSSYLSLGVSQRAFDPRTSNLFSAAVARDLRRHLIQQISSPVNNTYFLAPLPGT